MNDREKNIVTKMIQLYCRSNHQTPFSECKECSELASYACDRLESCTFGEEKPMCKKCPIHCYKKDYREKIRQVMRFAGPRMILHHPLVTIKHLFSSSFSSFRKK